MTTRSCRPALAVFGIALVSLLFLSTASLPAAEPSPSPSDVTPPVDQAETAVEAEAQAATRCCCKKHRCGLRKLRLKGRLLSRCRGKCCGTTSVATAAPDPYAWKDLLDGKTLDGWKITQFGGEGEVRVEDGAVIMEMGNMMTGITYEGEVLRDNYELTLEGKRVDGVDFFCTTTFPVGEDPCSLVLGGWGGTVVGLSNVDFYDASDNLTTKFFDFKQKQWYKIRIRVTPEKIEAWIDDEQMVDQKREGHKFDIRFEVDLCKPLGIAAYATTGAVRNVRVRKLPPGDGDDGS